MSFVFDQIHGALHGLTSDLKDKLKGSQASSGQGQQGEQATTTQGGAPGSVSATGSQNRFQSFAPERDGNDIKWYVDGCSYMWAVSVALERARESIWILDWWLSPELYLRRPPAKNEQYRLDRMLEAAAQRGVKINIIVYKEVTQVLTRKLPNLCITGRCQITVKNMIMLTISFSQCPPHIPNITWRSFTPISLCSAILTICRIDRRFKRTSSPLSRTCHLPRHHFRNFRETVSKPSMV